jgi:hypothetical protein
MALQYTKEELEAIATRLQCCAVDAANEALTGEVFQDAEKKKCGWNKFKYLQGASNILKNYYPGGLYPFTQNLTVENTIVAESTPYTFRCATSVDNHLSPFHGFSFVVFGDVFTGDTLVYVIKDGDLYSIFGTNAYPGILTNISSVVYDGKSHNLIFGAYENVHEFDISPLLNDPIEAPIAVSTTYMAASTNDALIYNYVDKFIYVLDIANAQVIQFDTSTDTFATAALPNSPNNSNSMELNRVTGDLWIANNGPDITIIDMSGMIVSTFSVTGALYIYSITYNTNTNQFIVSYFTGLTNKVMLYKNDGTPVGGSILQNSESINDALYYNYNDNYFVAIYPELLVANNPSIALEGTLKLIQDVNTNRVLAIGTSYAYDSQTNYISVISVPTDAECLTDDDVEDIIEMSQQLCCDCCPAPSYQADYSEAIVTENTPAVTPTTLYKIYYGTSSIYGLGKVSPSQLATLTSINRYEIPGIYNYYAGSSVYLYFAVPEGAPLPTSFYDLVTSSLLAMLAPYKVTIDGVIYKVYQSTASHSTNFSLSIS